MVFQKITKDNLKKLYPYLYSCNYGLCDYTPMVLLLWGDYYNYSYAEKDGVLYLAMQKNNITYFLLPIATDLEPALLDLAVHCEKEKIPLNLIAVPADKREEVESILCLGLEEMEEGDFDYVYSAKDLKELTGRKYNGQRNHINRFKRDNPTAIIRPLRPSDKPQLELFLEQYHCVEGNESCNYDREAVTCFVKNFTDFAFFGGVVYCEDKIVGVAFGDVVGDTLFVHVEKFLHDISGLGEVINNGFARLYATESIKWINREEDMGQEGLRKAKKSYYPTIRKKYCTQQP